jgi:hypothetical protein
VTKAVVKAGKPLVYVNRKPTNLPKGVVYCGSKSIEAGIMVEKRSTTLLLAENEESLRRYGNSGA